MCQIAKSQVLTQRKSAGYHLWWECITSAICMLSQLKNCCCPGFPIETTTPGQKGSEIQFGVRALGFQPSELPPLLPRAWVLPCINCFFFSFLLDRKSKTTITWYSVSWCAKAQPVTQLSDPRPVTAKQVSICFLLFFSIFSHVFHNGSSYYSIFFQVITFTFYYVFLQRNSLDKDFRKNPLKFISSICAQNLYVKSYPTSLRNYIFIEVVLKSYLDKLYFHKLYDELMHQNCVKSYLKKYTESCTQKLYDEFRT